LDAYDYYENVLRLIKSLPSKGTISVTHGKKTYELPLTAAKALAIAAWGKASRTNYTHDSKDDTFPRMYVCFRTKTARVAVFNQKLVVHGKGKDKIHDEHWVERGGRGWQKKLSEVGTIVAGLCFNELTDIDLNVAGAECDRLRRLSHERGEARRKRIAECLAGLHRANGSLIVSLNHLSPQDELALAEQIMALREHAAAALN